MVRTRAFSQGRSSSQRVVVACAVSLLLPMAVSFARPAWLATGSAMLVWTPAVVPAFALAYHRGWRGALLALVAAVGALAVVQVGLSHGAGPAPGWGYVAATGVLLAAVSVGAGAVTDRLHRQRETVERTALTDPLTGLANRRHASVFLEAAWAAAVRGRPLSVIMFDLDRFKEINDVHGHPEGDRVLKRFADFLAERTRRMDLSARFGGEEFLTVLTDCTLDHAEEFANEIRERMAEAGFAWGNVTVSAGVSTAEEGMGAPDVLLAAADRALYAAKDQGRNRVVRTDAFLQSAPPRPDANTAPSVPATASLEGARVLLVDDDASTLASTCKLLERLGCVVQTAESSRKALAELSHGEPPDVLITDIVMPDMSGFTLMDLASRVRRGLPVLYISGYPREEVYWGGTPGARSAFLSKPLEMEELRQVLADLLEGDRGTARAADRDATPAAADEAPRPSAGTPALYAMESRSRRPGQILVVDDDEAVVHTLQRLFTRAGYARPLGLIEPTRFLEVLREEDVDLVLLDLKMPVVDGFDILDALHDIVPRSEFFPVLVLTSDDDPTVRRRALEAGAMDFLNKPFDPAEAEARVQNLLETRFLTQRLAQERDGLEDRINERTSELADTRSEILHRLARAGEYRDDVTGRHAERVGLLSSRLAMELGLPPREVDFIRRTAPLHDLGKIGVPDAILRKPGKLTLTEFEIMKTHTVIGAQILGESSHRLLEVARDIALCHHERWDGLGYPHGRTGDETPLEARIVAVADTFDTISHARPYKAALPPAAAVAEIERCRGREYDPAVVDAFVSIRNRVGIGGLHGLGDPLDPLRDTTGLIA